MKSKCIRLRKIGGAETTFILAVSLRRKKGYNNNEVQLWDNGNGAHSKTELWSGRMHKVKCPEVLWAYPEWVMTDCSRKLWE